MHSSSGTFAQKVFSIGAVERATAAHRLQHVLKPGRFYSLPASMAPQFSLKSALSDDTTRLRNLAQEGADRRSMISVPDEEGECVTDVAEPMQAQQHGADQNRSTCRGGAEQVVLQGSSYSIEGWNFPLCQHDMLNTFSQTRFVHYCACIISQVWDGPGPCEPS